MGVAVSTDHAASTVSANMVIVAQSQELDTGEAWDPIQGLGWTGEACRVRGRRRFLDAYDSCSSSFFV